MNVLGWKVTGATDLYDGKGVITDIKNTSVWSVLRGVKDDWVIQLNLYCALWRNHNWPVTKLQIIAILRDWSKHQIKRSSDYPKHQVQVLPVPLWLPEDAHKYMTERVTLHQEAEHLSDADLPMCSPGERWERPTTYAVKVKGQKRAKRVLESMEEAEVWAKDNMKKDFDIEVRPGESVRCESYCDCSQFCDFKKGGSDGRERTDAVA
jgi:hypothetical protein